jgi:hypothetical protein
MHIRTFDLINDFEKRDFDFLEDRLTVKVKSSKAEYAIEIKYEQIKIIQYQKRAELNWIWSAFVLLGISFVIHFISGFFMWRSPPLLLIEKAIVVSGLLFSIPAFHKREYCSFLDSDRNYLASIKVNKQDCGILSEAINLIKQKANGIRQTNPKYLFADTKPIFQITQFEVSDFLKRSITRFYEDRMIDQKKSLAEELATEIKYSELSGKTQVVKIRDDKWGYIWSYWLIFISFSIAITTNFFPSLPKAVYIGVGAGLVLLVPMYFLRFIKRKTLYFYNKNDQIIYWTRLNSADRPKLDKIVEFIKSKVTPNNKNSESIG